jgi:hypothetical protein
MKQREADDGPDWHSQTPSSFAAAGHQSKQAKTERQKVYVHQSLKRVTWPDSTPPHPNLFSLPHPGTLHELTNAPVLHSDFGRTQGYDF